MRSCPRSAASACASRPGPLPVAGGIRVEAVVASPGIPGRVPGRTVANPASAGRSGMARCRKPLPSRVDGSAPTGRCVSRGAGPFVSVGEGVVRDGAGAGWIDGSAGSPTAETSRESCGIETFRTPPPRRADAPVVHIPNRGLSSVAGASTNIADGFLWEISVTAPPAGVAPPDKLPGATNPARSALRCIGFGSCPPGSAA